MNYPPPPPFSKVEFDRRIKQGAVSFLEIDPEFTKWYNHARNTHAIKSLVMFVCCVSAFFFAIIMSFFI